LFITTGFSVINLFFSPFSGFLWRKDSLIKADSQQLSYKILQKHIRDMFRLARYDDKVRGKLKGHQRGKRACRPFYYLASF